MILVGALLAATTGVVAAAVISMGLISLPIMLRYGYNRTIATGTITASGTLAQAIPPSLVLIVLADQLGRSVGDMYSGAWAAFLAADCHGCAICLSFISPTMFPAIPKPDGCARFNGWARIYREDKCLMGIKSLFAHSDLSPCWARWVVYHSKTVPLPPPPKPAPWG